MKLLLFSILVIFAGCNSKVAKLSPIASVTGNGLFVSPIGTQYASPSTLLSVPFTISDQSTTLSCIGSVTAYGDDFTLLPLSGISITGTAPNCILNIVPAAGASGTGNITLEVTNGKNFVMTSFPVFISAQVPPSPLDIGTPIEFNEDTEYIFTLPYTDANGDLATACSIDTYDTSLVDITTPCSCDPVGECTVGITGKPNFNAGSALSFLYTLTDDDGTSGTATVFFKINPVNDAPTMTAIPSFSEDWNLGVNQDFDFSISDIEQGALPCGSVTSASSDINVIPNNGLISTVDGVTGDCRITLTPLTNVIGESQITLTVTDSGGLTASQTFTYKLTGWGQTAYIKSALPAPDDKFGYNVSLDGDTLAVSAEWDDNSQNTITNGSTVTETTLDSNSGAVYIYRRTGNVWVQEAYIKADYSGPDDNFGESISLSRDTLAVGAMNEDSASVITTATGIDNDLAGSSGAVYIFKRTGTTWAMERFIKPSNNAVDHYFGDTVSLKGDVLAVSATGTDDGASGSGSVYIFNRSGTNWTQSAYLKLPSPTSNDAFGWDLSISENLLAVGVPYEDSTATGIGGDQSLEGLNESGAVFIYHFDGNNWVQEEYLKGTYTDSNDQFGRSISLDGNKLAVGVPYESSNEDFISPTPGGDNDFSSQSGAVYVFKRVSGTWLPESYIKADFNHPGANFGKKVSLKGETLVVGTLEDISQNYLINGVDSYSATGGGNFGSAYVYRFNGSAWEQEAYLKPTNAGDNDQFGYSLSISGDTVAISAIYEDGVETSIRNNSTTPPAGNDAVDGGSSDNSGAVYIFRNNKRLFDVTEVWVTSSDTTITLNWLPTGGTANGYWLERFDGIGTPSNCDGSTSTSSTSYQYTGLTSNTDYTFRICATDGTSRSFGKIIQVKTKSSGGGFETAEPAENL